MRITRPPADARLPLEQIDLTDTGLYVSGDAHLVWQTLRAECPVFWQDRADGRGFWAVTRRVDVHRVLSDYRRFSSEGGTAIAMLDGSDPAAGLMMQSTDPPRHRGYRDQLGRPFSARAVPEYTAFVRSLAREAMEPARDGEVWDLAATFVRLPMALCARMMGLPQADVDPLLRLAYACLAPDDPRYRTHGSARPTAGSAHYEIMGYFAQAIGERRKHPRDDLTSYLMSIEVDGRRLSDEELLYNCLSLLLGAVVTTSHVLNATTIALAADRGGEGCFPEALTTPEAVEEALRWASPVTHFMRRARADTTVGGRRIAAGDAVTAWIASANRDEHVFARPYELDLARTPNQHIVFGTGPHTCLGSHLARLMLRTSFTELTTAVESYEIVGEPVHLASNEIAGVVSLQLRTRFRSWPTRRAPAPPAGCSCP